MSKKSVQNSKKDLPAFSLKKIHKKGSITEYRLTSNDLRVLYVSRKGTGVVTSNIVYLVGSRDEMVGETGIAHMFEHMLFKPTTYDIKRKIDSSAMHFERETGATLNANTWKDRTTYYFAYPKEHFSRALQIEAERMHGLVLTNETFIPEQKNVLSEFDMYAGDEHFALSVQMVHAGFNSHPYGHETIGYREDIESYTIEKLKLFYDMYYAPNNAVLTIVGDVSEKEMASEVCKHFGPLRRSLTLKPRTVIREPKQEGSRSIVIKRPSSTNIYALGIKHDAFPTKEWFETMVVLDMLGGSDDSILHKQFVDTGLASQITTSLEPTREKNLGIIYITLTKKSTHASIHTQLRTIIDTLTIATITPYIKKTLAKVIASELSAQENSLSYTAELVEYVSAGAWEQFGNSEKILRDISPQRIKAHMHKIFEESQTITGHFVGTK